MTITPYKNHFKFIGTLILLLITIQTASAQVNSKAKVDTVFFDDFSGKNIDRTKWNVEITGRTVNNEQQAYVDSTATIYSASKREANGARQGAVVLKAISKSGYVSKEGKKYDFLSGRMNTKGRVEFVNGTAAARIKLTEGQGLWPAFWALGTGRWPDTGEIDIMEYVGESDWTSTAIHGPGYSGNTPIVNRHTFLKGQDPEQWHVYSVDWTSEGFVFKLDGVTTYEATRAMIEKYGTWAFDNPKYLILNFALGGGYPFGVNKVQTPYNGLPQSSVDIIKKGDAKMIVDWGVDHEDKLIHGLFPTNHFSCFFSSQTSGDIEVCRDRDMGKNFNKNPYF